MKDFDVDKEIIYINNTAKTEAKIAEHDYHVWRAKCQNIAAENIGLRGEIEYLADVVVKTRRERDDARKCAVLFENEVARTRNLSVFRFVLEKLARWLGQ